MSFFQQSVLHSTSYTPAMHSLPKVPIYFHHTMNNIRCKDGISVMRGRRLILHTYAACCVMGVIPVRGLRKDFLYTRRRKAIIPFDIQIAIISSSSARAFSFSLSVSLSFFLSLSLSGIYIFASEVSLLSIPAVGIPNHHPWTPRVIRISNVCQ